MEGSNRKNGRKKGKIKEERKGEREEDCIPNSNRY